MIHIVKPSCFLKWHSMRALLYLYDLQSMHRGLSDIVQYDKIIMRVNFIDFQI